MAQSQTDLLLKVLSFALIVLLVFDFAWVIRTALTVD